jgi:hypothetical protein
MQVCQKKMLYFGSVRRVSELNDSYPNSIDYIGQGSMVIQDRTTIERLEGITSTV